MALTYTASVLAEHAKLIEENIETQKAVLSNRGAVPDYAAYCTLVGKIEGLRLALDLCDEAVKRVNER